MTSSDASSPLSPARASSFATTRWSLIVKAGGCASAESRTALAELCGTYWHPLYAYLRRRGLSQHDAQDTTQEFFALLLEKGTIARADARRGRFRSFLLASLKKFLANERRKTRSQKRGGGRHVLSFDFETGERQLAIEPAHHLTPEKLYERRWALLLLERVVVHRDIKPENILLDRQGNVKIADFGLAKLLSPGVPDSSITGSQQALGTPHYMAPEQLEHPQQVDHRADLYALGVVFYEMLTGELPLGRFAPPPSKAAIDLRIDEVVHKALEKEPERRYQSAVDVKSDVDGIAATAPTRASPRVGSRGSLARLWRDLRADWPVDAWQVAKVALLCLYVYCMLAFFSVAGNQGIQRAGGIFYSHLVGAPRAWLTMYYWESTGLKTGLRFDSEGWWSLIAGVAAYYGYWRIRKTETGGQQRFRLPWPHVAFWLILALISIGSGLDARLHEIVVNLWSLEVNW